MNTTKHCMPDEVTTEAEHYQYLSDIGNIEWEFESWAEKSTYEAFIKGVDKEGNEYTAIAVKDGDSFESIHDVELRK